MTPNTDTGRLTALLSAVHDLVDQRAGTLHPAPGPPLVLHLDEAATCLAHATPTTPQLLTDLFRRGRASHVTVKTTRHRP